MKRRIYVKKRKLVPTQKGIETPKPQRDPCLFDLSTWNGALNGYPAFLLGNGCSIRDISDWSKFEPFFTIGINRIFLEYDPTILLWQDRPLWLEHSQKIASLKAIRVARTIADPENYALHYRLVSGSPQLTSSAARLYGSGNTGFLAVQLAIVLGCNPLILIGMDCRRGENGDTDFYGENKHHQPHTMANCMRGLKWVKDKCPINIINCGDSGLWEKRDINEVLSTFNQPRLRKNREAYKQILYDAKLKAWSRRNHM